MPSVALLADSDRRRLASTVEQAWAGGLCAWVLDADATDDHLAATLGDLVRASAIDEVRASGRATVDLQIPADTATIVTSSGTTGHPKVVCLSRSAMDASGRGAHAHLDVGAGDRWLLALPLHHVAGQSVLWRSRMLGVAPLVQDRLDVAAANAAGVTVVSLVPTQLHRLVAAGQHLDARVLLGGATISPRLLAAADDHVGGVTRSYGLTETCGGCVYDGVPFPGVEVAVRDGVLGIRGPVLAAGRLTPEGPQPVTDDDGWLWTDDLGAVADGVVSVTGRADDAIVTGGVNVDPATVEVVLEDHPAVARAGVVGIPDDEWGEVVTAAVVLDPRDRSDDDNDDGPGTDGPDGSAPDDLVDDLGDRVRHRLGPAAVPRRFVVVDALPLTSLGKVARQRLRAQLT